MDDLLRIDDNEIVVDTLWALSSLTETSDEAIRNCCESINVSRIINMMVSEEGSIRVLAIRIIGNLCRGPIDAVEKVIRNGGLVTLKEILSNKSAQEHYKEVCWIISNIVVDGKSFITSLIDSNIFPELFHLIESSNQFIIRREAAWALANTCIEATEYQTMKLVELGVIPFIIKAGQIVDYQLQGQVVEGIENLLNCGANIDIDNQVADIFIENQGVTLLEGLTTHSISDISNKAEKLINLYFSKFYSSEELMMIEDIPYNEL